MLKINYLFALAIGLAGACSSKKETAKTSTDVAVMAGADQDEHGCKASAGYQWSAVQKKCVQLFEAGIRLEPMQEKKGTVAYLLFASPDEDAQAEIFLPGQPAGLMLTKTPGDNAGTWTLDTLTLSQWKGMYSLSGAKGTVLYEGHIEVDESVAGESAASGVSGSDVPTMLAGTWDSLDDPKERFTIDGKTLTRYYDGKKLLALTLTYLPNCKGGACEGRQSPYGCITTAGQFDIDCQTIGVITDTELALSMGSTEKFARYRKNNSR
ncbi:MAG: hypothetical protein H7319_13280 [Spirosoma sp.]|nr:hypothetical protein [Spirosoma sp.]